MKKRFYRSLFPLAVLSTSLFLSACASGPRAPLLIDMDYRPTGQLELKQLSGVLAMTPIGVGNVDDARAEPRLEIGRNVEHAEAVPIQSAPARLVATIRRGLEENLRQAGLRLSPNADVLLNFQIERAYVTEDNVYTGEIRLRVSVVKGGHEQGQLLVAGSAKRWGSSLSAENYQEALSDAVGDAVLQLLTMEELSRLIAAETQEGLEPAEPPM